MNEKKERTFNILICLGFIFYYLILLVERLLALILSVNQGEELALINHTFIGLSTYIITALSVVGGTILLAKPLLNICKSLFKKENYDLENNYKILIIGSMVFLVSGMMHTGYTLAPIQFVAYGFLILSMIISSIRFIIRNPEDKFGYIVSLIYLILFSMAIPVVYTLYEPGTTRILFYLAEFLAVFILIPIFGYSLYKFFINGVISFCLYGIIPMIILDGFIIGLKWVEEINYFLLIFASLTTLFYMTFGLIYIVKKK